ncbi:MAG: twin-arginine translocase subunit TatC [Kiritimatiellae bacterium]|nr:twin-arginine translocase subunit TatC [Kiritimatiellia bacterium]
MKESTDVTGDPVSKPFLEHLEDLRRTLFCCLIVLGIGVLVALPLTPFILNLLKRPLVGLVENIDQFLLSIEVAGAISVAFRISFWGGLLLSSPFLLFFLGSFIFPGLKTHERKIVLQASAVATLLFFIGVAMGYFITLPVALKVMFQLHEWIGVQMLPRVTNYVAFTTQLLIGFGFAFEMPVVVIILGRLGVLKSRQLRSKRRHVMVGLLIVAMLLTPPDIFTQLIMAIPLIILYEICIWVLWTTEKRKKEHENNRH